MSDTLDREATSEEIEKAERQLKATTAKIVTAEVATGAKDFDGGAGAADVDPTKQSSPQVAHLRS
jgi:hypothetical protein